MLQREKPDGILLSCGGQTALNLGVQMQRMGLLEKYGVKVLGTSVATLELSEVGLEARPVAGEGPPRHWPCMRRCIHRQWRRPTDQQANC